MTVAILSNTSWSILNFRKGLVRALLAAGHRVVALAPQDRYGARVAELGVVFHPLNSLSPKGTNPIEDIRLVREIAGHCRREGVEVIYTFTPKGNIYGCMAADRCGITALPTVNGLGYGFQRRSPLQHVLRLLYRRAFRRRQRIFIQNPDDADLLTSIRVVRPEQVHLVPGSGVDVHAFGPSGVAEDGDLRMLMSARLVREKGVLDYLEAAATLVQDFPKIKFGLYGLPTENPSAISADLVRKLCVHPNIEYLGYTDNMNAAFDTADVFVLPSYYREGIPRVLIEALAKGKPIVTTDSVGCREVVLPGENGLLVPPRSPSALVGALREMITMPRHQLIEWGHESRRLAETKFDERIVIRKMLAAL
jgi:glycosyltransferase involved in cell wall biosynthesis